MARPPSRPPRQPRSSVPLDHWVPKPRGSDAPSESAPVKPPPRKAPQPARSSVPIDTYFGFFAESIFKAIQGSLTQQTGIPVSLEGIDLSQTNTLKLRWSNLDTVIVPKMVIEGDIPFVLVLNENDVKALNILAQERVSLQRMMEQAVSSAVEPFNFITKRRNRLASLQFSRNVTGLTAHHLDGEVVYTMATGHYRLRNAHEFALRLLVTGRGRDRIEDRTTAKHTQRALFSIIEGAYVCSPQWDPPPPPPEAEAPGELSASLTAVWMQSFFTLNDGVVGAKIFGQPAAFHAEQCEPEVLQDLAKDEQPITVVRLMLNNKRELEAFVVLRGRVDTELMRLSKSAETKFLGELFRVLFSEAAKVWRALTGLEMQWRVLAVRRIPADAIDAVTSRLEGGGVVVGQQVRLDEGDLDWYLALPPHLWHWLMLATAKAMDLKVDETPDREKIFQATGWGSGTIPWRVVFSFFGDRDLQILVRQLERYKLGDGDMAAIGKALTHGDRDRWLEAMPVMLRERCESYKLMPGEATRRQVVISQVLIDLNRRNALPEGRLSPWLTFFAEFQWQRRQRLIDSLLPLRHMVYGMERASLSRLLYDEENRVLEDLLCSAEFPVLDQVRRVITPGFAIRLLENVSYKRPRTSAYAAQLAQVSLYRRANKGTTQGRYLIRETPAKRLQELIRYLDESY